jgi:hypothetical protein
MQGTSQATPWITGVALLAQQLAQQELNRRLSVAEFRNLLATTGVVINDGDNENDNVRNTGLNFPRVDMLALAEGILALKDKVSDTGSNNPDSDSSGNTSTFTPSLLPLTHTVTVTPGQVVEDIDFGNRQPGILAFSSSEFSINEDGRAIAAVTINRINGSDGIVSATVSLSNGTAIAPGDYDNNSITVTFENGETSKTITLPLVNDVLYEADETINLTLSNPTGGATIDTQSTATVTIANDDALAIANPISNLNATEDASLQFHHPCQYLQR